MWNVLLCVCDVENLCTIATAREWLELVKIWRSCTRKKTATVSRTAAYSRVSQRHVSHMTEAECSVVWWRWCPRCSTMLACCGQVLQPTTHVDRVSGRVRPAAAAAAAAALSLQRRRPMSNCFTMTWRESVTDKDRWSRAEAGGHAVHSVTCGTDWNVHSQSLHHLHCVPQARPVTSTDRHPHLGLMTSHQESKPRDTLLSYSVLLLSDIHYN